LGHTLHQGAPVRKPLPFRVRLYIWLVAAAAVGLFAWWRRAWQAPVPADVTGRELMGLLFALAVLASHVRLHITRGRDMSVVNAVYFAALLLFGAPAAMLLVGASAIVGEVTLSLRRHWQRGTRLRSVHQILFSASQHAVGAGV